MGCSHATCYHVEIRYVSNLKNDSTCSSSQCYEALSFFDGWMYLRKHHSRLLISTVWLQSGGFQLRFQLLESWLFMTIVWQQHVWETHCRTWTKSSRKRVAHTPNRSRVVWAPRRERDWWSFTPGKEEVREGGADSFISPPPLHLLHVLQIFLFQCESLAG